MDKNGWFKEPVTEKIAQGYHKVIKTPMDLSTILKKVRCITAATNCRFVCCYPKL